MQMGRVEMVGSDAQLEERVIDANGGRGLPETHLISVNSNAPPRQGSARIVGR